MINYKTSIIEFIGQWHKYQRNQDSLTMARNTGDAEMITHHLIRINEIRDDLEKQSSIILKAVAEEDEKRSQISMPSSSNKQKPRR